MHYICQNCFLHTIHSTTFQPSMCHSQGVLIHFVSRVNKNMSRSKYLEGKTYVYISYANYKI